MRISILAVGTRMQRWVDDGVENYTRRLPRHIRVELAEIPGGTRTGKGDPTAAIKWEAEQLLRRIRDADRVIALDQKGRQWTTEELAEQMRDWLARKPRVVLMIGGADGLGDNCRQRADAVWSLSRLTLPHGLVRVVVAEQLYRAWTILQGHPYHRP
jgi:23S rRNA (pseudouridine1915-N3)-methyltransferase